MSYIGQAPGLTARSVFRFVATQGQTTFSGLDANGLTLGYTRDALDVYINGNLVTPSTDFTATDGSSIVLSQALSAGDEVIVIANSPFSQADHYTKDAADNRFAQFANLGFRNLVINGGFDVWQRGTSLAASGYLADRWRIYNAGASLNSQSRQTFTPGQTDVPGGPTYFKRLDWAGTAATSSVYLLDDQYIEDVRLLAGKTVTLSFWAKASVARTIGVSWGQGFGTGGSAQISAHAGTANLTTSWQRFTVTFTLPSISGKTLGPPETTFTQLRFWFSASADYAATSGAGLTTAGGTFDYAMVQLEEGSVATPFERRPLIIEETLCMRYARRISAGSGAAASSSVFEFPVEFVPPMRAAPSFTPVGTFYVEDPSTTVYPQSSPTVAAQYTNTHGAKLILSNFSGLSADIPYFVSVYHTDNHIFADAEL